ncbi:cytochrome b-245 chaperone 1 homolog [Esox lucius]|uniref:Essential for reactive oxygen species protein n=1 Tax=Esox lucius TaxID=8010 RepID=A0AAY5KBT8_ESOLU|nr:cytochrome b-245 chaperone 1 homolog [Esox lucius]XP_010890216.1 cytochrome b-245 chaperone 1 homolog [Esox lucius]XP_010890218.1 cytochrome b-245 chaperone 1 homolog [Esox lucius]XP_019902086.1 cytochrome b-245 chaperone 1 homolog [Esox lucius]
MGYMKVEEHTPNMLHLKRSPGIRSWSLLVGIASIGLAAAYYSSDSILWKLFYLTGCVFVAMQNMEEWEEAVFDKANNLIELKTFSLYALILTMWRKGQEKVVLDMRHLRDVCVQEEKVRYLGKGYLLVLRLATGFSYPLTQSATMGGRSDVEAVALLLKRFLGLEELKRRREQESAREQEEDDELDLSSDSEKEGDFAPSIQ